MTSRETSISGGTRKAPPASGPKLSVLLVTIKIIKGTETDKQSVSQLYLGLAGIWLVVNYLS